MMFDPLGEPDACITRCSADPGQKEMGHDRNQHRKRAHTNGGLSLPPQKVGERLGAGLLKKKTEIYVCGTQTQMRRAGHPRAGREEREREAAYLGGDWTFFVSEEEGPANGKHPATKRGEEKNPRRGGGVRGGGGKRVTELPWKTAAGAPRRSEKKGKTGLPKKGKFLLGGENKQHRQEDGQAERKETVGLNRKPKKKVSEEKKKKKTDRLFGGKTVTSREESRGRGKQFVGGAIEKK